MNFPRSLAVLVVSAGCIIPSYAAAPVVSNIRAAQRPGTKLVDIYYNLADADSAALNVTVAVSYDGGAQYNLPAATFTGDFGAGIAPGVDRHVVWNAGIDWNGQFTTRGSVRVTAEDGGDPLGMARIPAGSFLMGDNFGVDGLALPIHSVYVSEFYLERFEVSKELWGSVYFYALLRGYIFVQSAGVAANHPVQSVSWYNAVKWCNARSQKEGRTPVYYTDAAQTQIYQAGDIDLTAAMVKWTANGYRLPTEAEWEKAARGGLGGNHYPWPSASSDYRADIDGSKANYASSGDPYATNGTQTTPVGYYNGSQIPAGGVMANGYGLYDMSGNVEEWCWDWYGGYSASAQADPRGAGAGFGRVFRGGGWASSAVSLRCARRYYNGSGPGFGGSDTGFRCALGQP